MVSAAVNVSRCETRSRCNEQVELELSGIQCLIIVLFIGNNLVEAVLEMQSLRHIHKHCPLYFIKALQAEIICLFSCEINHNNMEST